MIEIAGLPQNLILRLILIKGLNMSSVQSSVKIATTNKNGAGSSANLADVNTVLTGAGDVDTAGYEASNDNQLIQAESKFWNAPGTKEVRIDAVNADVTTTNFVDVDINLDQSNNDVVVNVINSKRGQIDTGSGDDFINLTVQTNNGGWSNKFSINTGDGDDVVNIGDGQNSQFTSLDINTGSGDDVVNLTKLNASADNVTRFIETGAGEDRILGSKGSDFISGGADSDLILAGAGNDFVKFDASDAYVDGGAGFDALIIQGRSNATITSNFVGFEAVYGEAGSAQNIRMDLQDGLVIRLGGDTGDRVTFNEHSSFTALSSEDSDALSGRSDVDTSGLQAYQTEHDGNTVTIWSDTDLV